MTEPGLLMLASCSLGHAFFSVEFSTGTQVQFYGRNSQKPVSPPEIQAIATLLEGGLLWSKGCLLCPSPMCVIFLPSGGQQVPGRACSLTDPHKPVTGRLLGGHWTQREKLPLSPDPLAVVGWKGHFYPKGVADAAQTLQLSALPAASRDLCGLLLQPEAWRLLVEGPGAGLRKCL